MSSSLLPIRSPQVLIDGRRTLFPPLAAASFHPSAYRTMKRSWREGELWREELRLGKATRVGWKEEKDTGGLRDIAIGIIAPAPSYSSGPMLYLLPGPCRRWPEDALAHPRKWQPSSAACDPSGGSMSVDLGFANGLKMQSSQKTLGRHPGHSTPTLGRWDAALNELEERRRSFRRTHRAGKGVTSHDGFGAEFARASRDLARSANEVGRRRCREDVVEGRRVPSSGGEHRVRRRDVTPGLTHGVRRRSAELGDGLWEDLLRARRP
ncbi:hypothetical protein B0H11DRAFT_2323570 [Mycena galericulata]|nr:hypothetical protein B0H11DRAFT_2323570 [Mycena galericulata]